MRTAAFLFACILLVPLAGRGADTDNDLLTQTQIETMQRNGWLTPEFEAAARELIEAKETLKTADSDRTKLELTLPGLEKSASAEDAKVARLKDELAHYDHPDETDFTALQAAMKDGSAKTEDQLALAQAYVWTYPGGAHTGEAEQDLQQIQKKIADQVQAAKDADAAQTAAQLKLLQRVKAHDLDLGGWRAFLQDKSQDEVRQYLGDPTAKTDDYWTYSGAWTIDPATNQKAGLQLTFNGGRVQNVSPIPVANP
jgi:hypothetical protein